MEERRAENNIAIKSNVQHNEINDRAECEAIDIFNVTQPMLQYTELLEPLGTSQA